MNLWIKHPRSGQRDSMLTLSVVSLGVILVKFFLCDMTFGSITFGPLDASVIAAILAPTLTAYVARKHKDAPEAPQKDTDEEGKKPAMTEEEMKLAQIKLTTKRKGKSSREK